MLEIKEKGKYEVSIADGGFVGVDGLGLDFFSEWDDLPEPVRMEVLRLKETISWSIKALADLLQVEEREAA